MRAIGKTLELFFVDGRVDGLLTAQVFNWTGHVLRIPRLTLSDGLRRNEAKFTGVYVLVGENNGKATVYIGEGENIGKRVEDHARNRGWWHTAVLVSTAANNLHKGHIDYLEGQLIQKARSAQRYQVENSQDPTEKTISESIRNDMDVFLEYLFMVLPAIGIDVFEDNLPLPQVLQEVVGGNLVPIAQEVRFVFSPPHLQLHARAVLRGGQFIVQKDSEARAAWQGVQGHSYHKLFEQLRESGVLALSGDRNIFTRDYVFGSTSAAAAVVRGTPATGPNDWKLEGTEKTYKEWEEEGLSQVENEQ